MTKTFRLSPGGPSLFSRKAVNRLFILVSVAACLPVSMKCESHKEPLLENPQAETIGLDGLLWNRNSNFRSRSRLISDSEGPEKFHLPPGDFTETSVPLDVFERPQYVFTIHGNTTRFNFNVEGPLFERTHLPVFKISVIIETMNCYSVDQDEVPPTLIIKWVSDNRMYNSRFCSSFDNTKNSFQTVVQVQDGMSNVSVFGEGNWKRGMNARLVASLYTDVGDSCDSCPSGFFCCGLRGSSCPAAKKTSRIVRPSSYFLDYSDDLTYRCIPSAHKDSLQCNGHPNCGFFCNADESRDVCFRGGDSVRRPSCFGGSCNMGDVALRIGILIVSCFLLPPLLILLLCRFQVVRGGFDRCISFAVRNVNRSRGGLSRRGLGSSTAEEDADFPPGYRDTPEPPPYNAAEDPPPSYDEYIQSKGGRHFSAPIYTIQLTSPPRRRDSGATPSSSIHLPPPPPYPPPCSRCSLNANCFSGDSNYSSLSTCTTPPPPLPTSPPPPSPPPPPSFQTDAQPSGGIANDAFEATE